MYFLGGMIIGYAIVAFYLYKSMPKFKLAPLLGDEFKRLYNNEIRKY